MGQLDMGIRVQAGSLEPGPGQGDPHERHGRVVSQFAHAHLPRATPAMTSRMPEEIEITANPRNITMNNRNIGGASAKDWPLDSVSRQAHLPSHRRRIPRRTPPSGPTDRRDQWRSLPQQAPRASARFE